MGATAPGSYLVLTHVASDINAEAMAEMAKRLNRLVAEKGTMRNKAEMTLAEPGIVQPQLWRPTGPVPEGNVTAWCGVAGKP
jgi:hypothetical protein